MSSHSEGLHLWLVVNGKHAGVAELRLGVEDLRRRGHRADVRVTRETGDAERYAGGLQISKYRFRRRSPIRG